MSLNICETTWYKLSASPHHKLHQISFNQDRKFLSCAAKGGLIIISCSDDDREVKKVDTRDFSGVFEEGLGVVQMLFGSRCVAIAPKGVLARKAILYDMHLGQEMSEVRCPSEVLNLKLRTELLVVTMEKKVQVLNNVDFLPITIHDTYSNPKGLCDVSVSKSAEGTCMVAFPSMEKGSVIVEEFDLTVSKKKGGSVNGPTGNPNIPRRKRTQIIKAHEGPLSCIALNLDGSQLATASERGTLIRVWSTQTGNKLKEFRRGTGQAEIYSIDFSRDSQLIVTSSDSGTIHVFNNSSGHITSNNNNNNNISSPIDKAENRRSAFYWIGVGNYVSWANSEWSFAEFKDPALAVPNVCVFGDKSDTLKVMTATGQFLRLKINFGKKSDSPLNRGAIDNFNEPTESTHNGNEGSISLVSRTDLQI